MAKNRIRLSNAGLLGLPTHETNKLIKIKRESKPRGFVKSAILYSSTFYLLYWILYACPHGVPSEDAPTVCRQYYNIKHALVKNAGPIAQPYYEQYAGPYIAKGQPYYEKANALYSHYGAPVVEKTGALYSAHVHPSLIKTADGAKSQFSTKIAPKIEPHVTRVYSKGHALYHQYLGKHVDAVHAQYAKSIDPYVTYARNQGVELYYKALPYGQAGLTAASAFYVSHVHPKILDLLSWISHFVATRVVPTIRRFYLLRVEPQVNKVSFRLFHFNVSTGFASLNKSSAESIERAVSESMLSSITFSTRIESTVIAGETHTIEQSEPSIDAKTQAKIDRQVIEELLTIAEDNINREGAAAEAALVDKLEDMLPALVRKEEILCKDYLTQLEGVTVDEVTAIEHKIISSAQTAANKGKPTAEIADDLRSYFIRAGKNVHTQAVDVKAHLSTVLDQLHAKTQKATFVVYSHVQTEAQNQRKQPEEKLRYDMEKATKKELRRLDALDDQVKAIEKNLNAVSAKILKEYTKQLTSLIKQTESDVERLAGGAARKLQTLHSLGPKKITVGDDSDQFGDGYLPVGAMLGAQAIYNQLSTGVFGAPEPTPELPERILASAKSVASSLSANVDKESILSIAAQASSIASEQGLHAASAISVAVGGAGSAISAISEAAPSVDLGKVRASVDVAQSYVGEQAADIAAAASEAIYGTPQAFTESIQSKVSEAIYGTQEPVASSVLHRVSEAFDVASEKANSVLHGTATPLADKIASKASAAVYGSETPLTASIAHKVEEAYTNAKEKIREFVHDGEEELLALSKSASSVSSSLSSVAAKSFASLQQAASSASSVAAASRESASNAAATEGATFVDKAWEDYANAKEKVGEVVSDLRDRVEL